MGKAHKRGWGRGEGRGGGGGGEGGGGREGGRGRGGGGGEGLIQGEFYGKKTERTKFGWYKGYVTYGALSNSLTSRLYYIRFCAVVKITIAMSFVYNLEQFLRHTFAPFRT